MTKLRLVRERKQDVGSEFDLRDLGRDPLISESFPFAALVIRGLDIDEASGFGATASHQGFHSKVHGDQGALVIHAAKLITGEHKVQAVNLFLFLIRNLEKLPSHARCTFAEINRLTIQLKDAMSEQHHSLHESVFEHLKKNKHRGDVFLEIGAHCAHHLNQAGFPIQPQGTEHVRLKHDHIHSFKRDMIASAKAENAERRRKVGGA